MTLLIACVTPKYVIAIADRRLSRGPKIVEDFATKAVMVCDRGAVLYSGIAELSRAGPRMDEWIVQVLAHNKVSTLSEAANVLRLEATKTFRSVSCTRFQRRHMFMITGWQVIAGSIQQPVIAVVSNALDDHFALPRAVEFAEVDSLPGTEDQPSAFDDDRDR